MKLGWIITAAAALTLAAPIAAQDISVRGVRVGAEDVPALAAFYQEAFGLFEVNHISGPGFEEVMMKFGEDDPGPEVVIMSRAADDPPGALPHIIFHVADMEAAVERVTASGGSVDRPATTIAGGASFAFMKDPQGNLIELLNAP